MWTNFRIASFPVGILFSDGDTNSVNTTTYSSLLESADNSDDDPDYVPTDSNSNSSSDNDNYWNPDNPRTTVSVVASESNPTSSDHSLTKSIATVTDSYIGSS